MPKFVNLRILVVFISLAILQSCNRRTPVACFVTPGQPMETGIEYEFKDCSDNAAEYVWDLGGGATSEKPTPLYTYTEPGIYNVVQTVSNKNKTDEMQRQITVSHSNLSGLSEGIYSGTYIETYTDSSKFNITYVGIVSVAAIDIKRIMVALNHGSFKSDVFGNSPDYSFVSAEEIEPARLDSMNNVKGFYEHGLSQFSFSLEGKDPKHGMAAWKIEFTGFKEN